MRVVVALSNTTLYLHGNAIAKKCANGVFVNHCGWKTNTTKERLNGLMDIMGRYKDKICQKNYVWYWKDGEELQDGWNKI